MDAIRAHCRAEPASNPGQFADGSADTNGDFTHMAELDGSRPLALTFGIEKVDESRREVWGIATAEVPDKQRDIVDFDASVRAFRAWGGNVREQHNKLKTVGKAIAIEPLPDQKAIRVGVFLSRSADGEDAWTKVREGILTGFSIGGTVKSQRPEIIKGEGSNALPQTFNRITGYDLGELSLVDNPACPVAKFDLVKAAGGQLHATGILARDDDDHGGRAEDEALRQPLRSVISDAGDEEKQQIPDEHSQAGAPAAVRDITHGTDEHKKRLLSAVDGVLAGKSRRATVAKVAGNSPETVTFVGTRGLTATWGDGGNLVIEKARTPFGSIHPGMGGEPGMGAMSADDGDEDDGQPVDPDQPMPDNSGNPQQPPAPDALGAPSAPISAAPTAPTAPEKPSQPGQPDNGFGNQSSVSPADEQPDQSATWQRPQDAWKPEGQGNQVGMGAGTGVGMPDAGGWKGDANDPHGSQWEDPIDVDSEDGGMPEGTIATHYSPESAQAHADALERGTGQSHEIVADGDAYHVRPFPDAGEVTPDDIVGTHFTRDAAEDKRAKIEARGGFPAAVHQTPDGRFQVFPVPARQGAASGMAPGMAPGMNDRDDPSAGSGYQGVPQDASQGAYQSASQGAYRGAPDPNQDDDQDDDQDDGRRGWTPGTVRKDVGNPQDPGRRDVSREARAPDGKWTAGSGTPDRLGSHAATYHGNAHSIHAFADDPDGPSGEPVRNYAITGRGQSFQHAGRREIIGQDAKSLEDHLEEGRHFEPGAERMPDHVENWHRHVDNVGEAAIRDAEDARGRRPSHDDGFTLYRNGSGGPQSVTSPSMAEGHPPDPMGQHGATYLGGTHAIHQFARRGTAGTADDPSHVYAITGRDDRPDASDRFEVTGRVAAAMRAGGIFDLDSHVMSPNRSGWSRHGWENHVDNVAADVMDTPGGDPDANATPGASGDGGSSPSWHQRRAADIAQESRPRRLSRPGAYVTGNGSDVHRDHLGNFTLTPAGGGTGHPHAQYLQGDDASQFHQELQDHLDNGRGSRASRVDDAVDPYIPDAARSPGKGQPGWHALPDTAPSVQKTVEDLMKTATTISRGQADQAEVAAVRDALLLLSRTLAKADAGVTAPSVPLYTKPRRNADGIDPDGYNTGGKHDAVSDDDEEKGQTTGASAGSERGAYASPLPGNARTATVSKRAGNMAGMAGNDPYADDDPDADPDDDDDDMQDLSWDGGANGAASMGANTGAGSALGNNAVGANAGDNPAMKGSRMGKADAMADPMQDSGQASDDPDADGADGADGEAGEYGDGQDMGAMKGYSPRRLHATIRREVAKALSLDGPATQSLQKVVSTTVGNVLKAVLAGHEDRLSEIEKRSAAIDAMDERLRAIEAQPVPGGDGPAMRAVEKSLGDLPGASGLERRIGEPRSGVIDRLRQRTLNKSDVSALESMFGATDGHDKQAIGNVLALQDLRQLYR